VHNRVGEAEARPLVCEDGSAGVVGEGARGGEHRSEKTASRQSGESASTSVKKQAAASRRVAVTCEEARARRRHTSSDERLPIYSTFIGVVQKVRC